MTINYTLSINDILALWFDVLVHSISYISRNISFEIVKRSCG